MRRALLAALVIACGRAPAPVPRALDAAPRAPDASPRALLDGVDQLVLGVADGWDATAATLQRYHREGARWIADGAPITATLGDAGLAWGRGIHGDGAPADRTGPSKREGDARSPAGAFALGPAFGDGALAIGLPYQPLDDAWRCVDDPESAHYGELVHATRGDWRSAEEMHIAAYARGLVVAHNPSHVRGAGSCIFVHVGDTPTVGCTAMTRADLDALLAWLRPGAVYVLLPSAERDALADAWGLPHAPPR